MPVFRHEGLGYLTGTIWSFRHQRFGVLPMVYGTLAVSGLALALAAPVGVGTAIFTSEYLSPRWRYAVKGAIELLAGVPSVVYGLLGAVVLREAMVGVLAPFEPLSGDSLATAGVLLAVMILPTAVSLADDALSGVPKELKRAARGLGLSHAQTIRAATLPLALPGIAAALVLALGRALGETIAIFLVIGRQDGQWPERLLGLASLAEAGQTLTTKLGGAEIHIAYRDPLHWAALAGLVVILLTLSVGISGLGSWLGRRAWR